MKVTINQPKVLDVKGLIARTEYANVDKAEATLRECLHVSIAIYAGYVDGEVACIWGLVPPSLMSDRAYLWLLTTELVKDHQFVFVRASQRAMEKMLEEYSEIVGHTNVNNDRGIRWLKWLGAEFQEPKGLAIPFIIRRQNG